MHQSFGCDQLERNFTCLHCADQLSLIAAHFVTIVNRGISLFNRVLQHCDRFHRVVNRAHAVVRCSCDFIRHLTCAGEADEHEAIFGAHDSRNAPSAMIIIEHGNAIMLL